MPVNNYHLWGYHEPEIKYLAYRPIEKITVAFKTKTKLLDYMHSCSGVKMILFHFENELGCFSEIKISYPGGRE